MWLTREEPGFLEGELRPLKGLEGWKKNWPPKYKRGPLSERRQNLSELIIALGRFLPADYSGLLPGPESGGKSLDAIAGVPQFVGKSYSEKAIEQ